MSSSPANANADGQNIMSVDENEKTKDFMRWGIVGLGDVCTKVRKETCRMVQCPAPYLVRYIMMVHVLYERLIYV